MSLVLVSFIDCKLKGPTDCGTNKGINAEK